MWHLHRLDNWWRKQSYCLSECGYAHTLMRGWRMHVCVCCVWWRTILIPAAIRASYSNLLFFKGHIHHIQSACFPFSLYLFLSPFNPLKLFKNVNEVDKMQYVYLFVWLGVCSLCESATDGLSTQNQMYWSPYVYNDEWVTVMEK